MIHTLDPEHTSLDYINVICRFLKNGDPRGWKKLRRIGREFPVKQLSVKQSLAMREERHCLNRQCYLNCQMAVLALDKTGIWNLDYYEGIATMILPTEHAWLVEKTLGWVIDPTWVELHQRARKPEHKIKDYFGVKIPTDIVREQVLNREMSGPLLPHVLMDLKAPQKPARLKEPE